MVRLSVVWALVLLFASTVLLEGSAQDRRPPELDVEFHRAEKAWRSGASVLEAKIRVDRVLDELPADPEARKLRAQILMSMDRFEEALSDAREAVQLRPQDGEAYLVLSEAARMNGDEHLAINALDAAAERVLEDADFHIRLSWNASLLGQLDRAEAYARIALALGPTRAPAYYQLARVFVRKEQMDDAAAILSRGLRQDLLDPATIQNDSVLTQISGHDALAGLMR